MDNKIVRTDNQTVATTALTVLGESTWTAADDQAGDRIYWVTNTAGSDLFLGIAAKGTTASTAVDSTDNYCKVLSAGEDYEFRVSSAFDLYAVSASSSVVNVIHYNIVRPV